MTVTEVGTVAIAIFEVDRLTTVPEGPASPLSVTVPVTTVDEPPTTEVGETATV